MITSENIVWGKGSMTKLRESDDKLLDAFSCALNEKDLGWQTMPDPEVWKQMYLDAQEHKIFPMIMERISRTSLFIGDETIITKYRYFLTRAESEIQTQAQRTADFLLLYEYLLGRGIRPLVVKGIVCRNLYPEPEHRPSADEDLLIDPREFSACHQALLEYGMELADPEEDVKQAYEVSYKNKDTLLYIELHKYLFPPEDKVFSGWNSYIVNEEKDISPIRIYGNELYTLNPTSHFIYLVLHVFKHFLYGGFGIRQIADIVLFSDNYVDQIDWEYVERVLTEVNAKDFVRAFYKIGITYLWKDSNILKSGVFPGWDFADIDEIPLLMDILEGGVYGASTMSRRHSSNMTLHAMSQQRGEDTSKGRALLHAVFLPRKSLEKRYPYLKKAPFLLPVAWTHRIVNYLLETGREGGRTEGSKHVTESITLGNKRIQLLKQYNIIKNQPQKLQPSEDSPSRRIKDKR